MSSTPSMRPNEPVAPFGCARCESDAAVSHDDSGDPVVTRGSKLWIPGYLTVVVGVHVDESGRDELAGGVDLFAATSDSAFHRDDLAVLDRDLNLSRGLSGAVENRSSSNHQVMHAG